MTACLSSSEPQSRSDSDTALWPRRATSAVNLFLKDFSFNKKRVIFAQPLTTTEGYSSPELRSVTET